MENGVEEGVDNKYLRLCIYFFFFFCIHTAYTHMKINMTKGYVFNKLKENCENIHKTVSLFYNILYV